LSALDELKIIREKQTAAKKAPKIARNVRNNNPGNIKDANINWDGMTGEFDPGGKVAEGRFPIFEGPTWGARALTRDLRSKIARGLTTIGQILPVYAPNGKENNTEAYIRDVMFDVGLDRDAPIKESHMFRLVKAITKHEGGPDSLDYYTDAILKKGMEMEKR